MNVLSRQINNVSLQTESKTRTMTETKKNTKRDQRFINEVSRKMCKVGFECHIEDDCLVIKKGDKTIAAEIRSIPGWGKRRVHFYYDFVLEGMNQVERLGMTLLVSECNNHCSLTTTTLWEDSLSCRVEATVHSAREFVREFNFADYQIGETVKQITVHFPLLKEAFPLAPLRRSIGFVNYPKEHEEKNEECKLVAWIVPNFAAENK